MIPIRQHIASLVAVFLALAAGLALGGALLSNDSPSTASSGSGSTPSGSPSSADADAIRQATYAERLVASGAARLYAAGLAGRSVAILTLPGFEQSQVKELNQQVVAAGGAITGRFAASTALLEASHESTVKSVGSQLVTQLADPRLDAGATTYVRMGQLLGLAMATTQSAPTPADAAALAVRTSLSQAKLLSSPDGVQLAPLLLVVLPPGDHGLAKDTSDTEAVLSGLTQGLGSTVAGVVVVGDTDSADGGLLAAVRSGKISGPIATVDGVEDPLGKVTAVLAMERVLSGQGGSFGASGKDGPVPLQ